MNAFPFSTFVRILYISFRLILSIILREKLNRKLRRNHEPYSASRNASCSGKIGFDWKWIYFLRFLVSPPILSFKICKCLNTLLMLETHKNSRLELNNLKERIGQNKALEVVGFSRDFLNPPIFLFDWIWRRNFARTRK